MQRKTDFAVGEYYHIYNRGTDKRTIFTDQHSYERFTALLYSCNSANPVNISEHFQKGRTFLEIFEAERGEQLVDIVAYCLMPNHFHLLIREKTEGGISKYMTKLLTGYSMYFNKKHTRSGTLFESKFKSKHADSDIYLEYLFAYLHLNPIKIIDPEWKSNGIQDRQAALGYLKDYTYSSYFEWQGKTRPESELLNLKAAPEYFSTTKDFDDFVNDWLTLEVD